MLLAPTLLQKGLIDASNQERFLAYQIRKQQKAGQEGSKAFATIGLADTRRLGVSDEIRSVAQAEKTPQNLP